MSYFVLNMFKHMHMIRIIIQNRKNSKSSIINRIITVKKAFNIDYIDAIKIVWKLKRRRGIVINTYFSDRSEAMQIEMEDIQYQLHSIYDTRERLLSDTCCNVPLDRFKSLLLKQGYVIYVALKPGFIDDNLNIF